MNFNTYHSMVELPHQIEGALLHQLDLHDDVVNLKNVDGQKDLEHLKKKWMNYLGIKTFLSSFENILFVENYNYAYLKIINNVG